MVSSQNALHSRFFLSDTQATDSTLTGCKARRAATSALGHTAPVRRRSEMNSSRTLMM
jgi:hypothetical protein